VIELAGHLDGRTTAVGGAAERRTDADVVVVGAVVGDHDHLVVDTARLDDRREVDVDVRLDGIDLVAHRTGVVDDEDDVGWERLADRLDAELAAVAARVATLTGVSASGERGVDVAASAVATLAVGAAATARRRVLAQLRRLVFISKPLTG
jgi:hypothetical protein